MIETTWKAINRRDWEGDVTCEHQWYIFRDGPVVFYVGESINILRRIRSHNMATRIHLLVKDWQVQLLTCQDVAEIVGRQYRSQECEWALIAYLHPCFNQVGVIWGDLRRKRPIEKSRILYRRAERAYQKAFIALLIRRIETLSHPDSLEA